LDAENLANKKRKSSLLNRESISKSDRRQSKAFTMSHEDTDFINNRIHNEQHQSLEASESLPSPEKDPIENEYEQQKSKRSKTSHHSNPVEIKKTPYAKKTIQNVSQTPTYPQSTSQSIEQAIEPLTNIILETNIQPVVAKQNSIFKNKQQTPKKSENPSDASSSSSSSSKELNSKLKNNQPESKNEFLEDVLEEASKSDPKSVSSKKPPHPQSKTNQLKDKPPVVPGSRPPRPPTSNSASNKTDSKKLDQEKDGLTSKSSSTYQGLDTHTSTINQDVDMACKNDSTSAIQQETPSKEKKKKSLLGPARSTSSINDNNSSTVNKENNNSLLASERNSISSSSFSILEQPLSENSRRSRAVVSYKEPSCNA
jgi:hypothetical protein